MAKAWTNRICSGVALMLVWLAAGCAHPGQPSCSAEPRIATVIFDTDIGSDCDDAGAMAVLHALADAGELRILGVIYSSGRIKYGVGVCDAINTYYGRGDLPLGRYEGTDVGDTADSYSRAIAIATNRFGHDTVSDAPDLLSTYRKLLESQPDRSVTILTVGHPHGLVHLMRDPRGMELIRTKVERWVAMGIGWNFDAVGMTAYSEELLKEWPLPFFVSPGGTDIKTGHRLLTRTKSASGACRGRMRRPVLAFSWMNTADINCYDLGAPATRHLVGGDSVTITTPAAESSVVLLELASVPGGNPTK